MLRLWSVVIHRFIFVSFVSLNIYICMERCFLLADVAWTSAHTISLRLSPLPAISQHHGGPWPALSQQSPCWQWARSGVLVSTFSPLTFV